MDHDDAIRLVRDRGGVIPAADLKARGASRRDIDGLIARGALVRPARAWVAVPDADAFLKRAAAAGVVLTCVTQAKRLGLWTLPVGSAHVAASPNAHPRPGGAVVHWHTPPVGRRPGELVDSIENVLDAVARCQPDEEAMVIWESAFNKRLVDRQVFARMPLSVQARALLQVATSWPDSGLETIFMTRLSWIGVPIVPQVWIAGHRIDILIGDGLAVQIDGAHHVGPQRESDIAHDAVLMQLGYHVLRFGYFQIIDDWPMVQTTIMRAVAMGLHHRAA